MQVVEVWRETQSFDCSVNIFLDMCGRVGDSGAVLVEGGESAFRRNLSIGVSHGQHIRSLLSLTEDLVANVVLSDKVSK